MVIQLTQSKIGLDFCFAQQRENAPNEDQRPKIEREISPKNGDNRRTRKYA